MSVSDPGLWGSHAKQMSYVRHQIEQCESKVSYHTQFEALMSARTVGQRRGVSLEVYRCPVCGEYHLTRNAQR